MELNHLKYFYLVAQKGSFTKAAAALSINQPGVSKAVGQLEETLGIRLLERHKRKVFLTKAGQEIFNKCERIFQDCSEIKTIAEGERSTCKGALAFCASEPIASHIVPDINEKMIMAFQDVVPATFCGTSSQLFEKISSGEFEFGLFFHIPNIGPDLEMKKLGMVPYDLIISEKHFHDKKIRATFIGSREVDDIKTRKFPTVERMRKYDPDVQIRISSNSLTAHKNMVLKGLGVSILPKFLVAQEVKAGQLKRLYPNEKFEFPLKLVLRKNKSLSRNARVWLEYLNAWIQSS
jgi:DNA-binding transcriptional LysR family regulator